tara:strand:- start:3893 stop:5077 length:1185 start_codon:yes stop_codon:yes gene_type:complete
MKVGVFFSLEKSSGGAYHQALKSINILQKIEEINFSFYNISSNKNDFSHEKINKYSINFIDKIFFLFYSSDFLKTFLKKFSISNKFEKFIKKENIDVIFFIGSSRLSIFCNKIDYITYIYEFYHIFRPDLPEYKGWTDFDFRESLIKLDVRKSVALIVDTKKKSKDLVKYYNCINDKINVVPLSSAIIDEKQKSNNTLSKNLKKFLDTKKEFYFYPAQYWSHKNHIYILEVIKFIKEKYNRNVIFVFTGSKKQNYKKIKETIEKLNLKEQVILLEYLNDYEIKQLYKNCNALVMPSLIGYSSLPLYEAFFFKKPVFYTKNLLEENLKVLVTEIDIDDVNSLANEIINFQKNKTNLKIKAEKAKIFFEENLTDEKISESYKAVFKKLVNLKKIYS